MLCGSLHGARHLYKYCNYAQLLPGQCIGHKCKCQHHKPQICHLKASQLIIWWYRPIPMHACCRSMWGMLCTWQLLAHVWRYNTATTLLPSNPWSLQVWAWQMTPSCWSQSQCCLLSSDHQSSPVHRGMRRIRLDCLAQTRLFGPMCQFPQMH